MTNSKFTCHLSGANGPKITYPAGAFVEAVEAAVPRGWIVDWETPPADCGLGRKASPIMPLRPLANGYRLLAEVARKAEIVFEETDCSAACFDYRGTEHLPDCPEEIALAAWNVEENARDEARAAWLASDEIRAWTIADDGGDSGQILAAPSQIEAELEAWVRGGDWDRERTLWIDMRALTLDPSTGTTIADTKVTLTVQLDPIAPTCAPGGTHDWQSPHEVLGGLRDNPGVHGKDGGAIIREVCSRCGAYKVTDTFAQRPDNGERGYTTVCFEEADDKSEAWVREVGR